MPRGMKTIGNKYAFFIPSTFYKEVKLCKNFEDVKYGSGYGIIVKKNKKQIEKHLNNTDWFKYSMRATNHCRHIGKKHIIHALIDGGFIDKNGNRNRIIKDYN